MEAELTRELLKYLLTNNGFFTSKQLAVEFSVSDKTIQRLIKKINVTAVENLIVAEKGRGYRLNYEGYLLNKDKIIDSKFPTENRQMGIVRELLLASPKSIRVDQIFDKFFISDSVIQNDERNIRKILRQYNLDLVRINRHLKVTGSEKDIRDALMETILKVNKEADLSAIINANDLGSNDVKFVLHQLDIAEKMLKSSLPYPYNINLFAHIYILLNRTRKFIKTNQHDLRAELIDDINMNPEIYSVCAQIVKNISRYLQMSISINETGYLFQYLVSSRLNYVEIEPAVNSLANHVSKDYVDLINNYLSACISQQEIIPELKKHILPLLNRLKNKIRLSNALIDEIQLEYNEVLMATIKASTIIAKKYDLPLISKDEAGFISLYFAKYLEIHQEKVNVLVICTTGIGTSELISTKMKKELPNIEVVDVIPSMDLKRILQKKTNIDLLVSTVPIKDSLSIPDVLVSAIFTEQDKVKVMKAITEVRKQ